MTAGATNSSRELILARIRRALADVPTDEAEAISRNYVVEHGERTEAEIVDLLAENLVDYRAHVHRCSEEEIPSTIARLLADHGSASVVIPDGLPVAWQSAIAVTRIPDAPDLTARHLDTVDSVISACALAIAETGTIVLDGGPGQGRRMLTLVPDHHVCVIRVPGQVVASVPRALPRLDPKRPLTWISGPSATSDIELDRVEGVHGPRTLDVILAD
jgi:L-lactate dehydrogenase complex protein LldG